MYRICAAIAIVSILSCEPANKTTMQISNNNVSQQGGFTPLFDGKSTAGWHSYGRSTAGKAWKVEDGLLHFDPDSKKSFTTPEGSDLVTNEEYDNFHLKLDWRISPKGNSGVIFYVKEDPKFTESWNTGLEMQVLDNGTSEAEGHPDGKIKSHRAGDLYDLIISKETAKPAGQWNTDEVVSNNGKLDFYLNGEHTLSTTLWNEEWKAMVAKSKFKDMPAFGTYKKGRIALQDHGDHVWYRNIMIKRL